MPFNFNSKNPALLPAVHHIHGSKAASAACICAALCSAKPVVPAHVQVAGLKLKVDNVERERDFYFSKLRDIEILCQRPELQAIPVGVALLVVQPVGLPGVSALGRAGACCTACCQTS